VGDWEAEDADLADSDGSRWLYCGVARRPLPGDRSPDRVRSRDPVRPR